MFVLIRLLCLFLFTVSWFCLIKWICSPLNAWLLKKMQRIFICLAPSTTVKEAACRTVSLGSLMLLQTDKHLSFKWQVVSIFTSNLRDLSETRSINVTAALFCQIWATTHRCLEFNEYHYDLCSAFISPSSRSICRQAFLLLNGYTALAKLLYGAINDLAKLHEEGMTKAFLWLCL